MIRDQASQAALLGNVRAFVRDVAMPAEVRVAAEDAMPEDLMGQMRRRGYFGWSIPEEYGGAGLLTKELAQASIELSQAAVAFRARVGINTGIGSESLIQDGSAALKRRYLPHLASGALTGALAPTEPEAGSDATALQTTGVPVGNDAYRLNGHERYIMLAPIADLFTVFARTEPGARGKDGITAFLLERGTPGLTTSGSTPKMGQEGAPIGGVFLRDCVVPADNIVGQPGGGFRILMKTLNKQRINLAALATGATSSAALSASSNWSRPCWQTAKWRLRRHAP